MKEKNLTTMLARISFFVGVWIIFLGFVIGYLKHSVFILNFVYMKISLGIFLIGLIASFFTENKEYYIPLNLWGMIFSVYSCFVLFFLGQFF